jgi:hypothetical protein
MSRACCSETLYAAVAAAAVENKTEIIFVAIQEGQIRACSRLMLVRRCGACMHQNMAMHQSAKQVHARLS